MGYTCIKCGDEWEAELPPEINKICPLCDMPAHQMVAEIYGKEGEEGVITFVKQIINKII